MVCVYSLDDIYVCMYVMYGIYVVYGIVKSPLLSCGLHA